MPRLVNSSSPVGSLEQGPIGHTTVPKGYLFCDGSLVSRTVYAALFAVIGTTFGAGDGSTTFKLPDYRGYFLRGRDTATAGRDPGGDRGFGTLQDDALQGHWHEIWGHSNWTGTYSNSGGDGANNNPVKFAAQNAVRTAISDGTNGTPRLASETRPKNYTVNYFIRF